MKKTGQIISFLVLLGIPLFPLPHGGSDPLYKGPIAGVATSVTAFVGYVGRGPIDKAVQVFSVEGFNREFGGLDPESVTSYAVYQYFVNGGREAWIVRTATGAQDLVGNRVAKTGMYALEDVSLFNILCIPAAAELTGNAPLTEEEAEFVTTAATAYCEERRAFLILDTPTGVDSVGEITDWVDHHLVRDENVGLFFPRIRIRDPLNTSHPKSVGACGTIAGLFARMDAKYGVWKAPAGSDATLDNVVDCEYALTDYENELLNSLGVNCLRSLPVSGNVCWGARTLVGNDAVASEWKYIPVRRTALFLEESISRGLRWVVLEPNDKSLWDQIRVRIGTFMHDFFLQGAFKGSTPKEAYVVKCDSETTTETDRRSGTVNVVVGFAPLRPAEFVILSLHLAAKPSAP